MPFDKPLILPDPTPGQIEDVRGDGTRLCLTVLFLGVHHHLTLVRARELDVDGDGFCDSGQEGWARDRTEWRADDPEDQADLVHLNDLYEANFYAVEVPGLPGRYIAYTHPFNN